MPVIKRIFWVVVSDGARYWIYSCQRLGGPLKRIAAGASAESQMLTKDIGTERPGRSQGSPKQARHAYANKVDWHDQAEKELAHEVAIMLNQGYARKSFQRLLLISPPKTLGEIRKGVRLKGLGDDFMDLDKDLTHLSEHELKKYLEKIF
ncbi:MAG: host attachment protein [Sphingomonadales bacterium]